MREYSPSVFIIILNFNGAKDTVECLTSIQNNIYSNYNIVIVDNKSTDNSREVICHYIEKNYTKYNKFESEFESINSSKECVKVTFIQSGKNQGYGHGNNIGIKYALQNKADYILVLNNDTIVEADFLTPLVDMCEKDKNIGIASCKINFYDKPDIIWFNGGKFFPCTAKVKHFNFNEKDIGQKPTETITFITGCMWLIPRKVLEDVGLINEEYFMYVEDLEFCKRITDKGYSLKVSGNSKIYHKVGSSSGHWSVFFAYWMSRNKLKFIKNGLKGLCFYSSIVYHILYMPLWWLLHKRFDLFIAHIKGLYSTRKGQDV